VADEIEELVGARQLDHLVETDDFGAPARIEILGDHATNVATPDPDVAEFDVVDERRAPQQKRQERDDEQLASDDEFFHVVAPIGRASRVRGWRRWPRARSRWSRPRGSDRGAASRARPAECETPRPRPSCRGSRPRAG